MEYSWKTGVLMGIAYAALVEYLWPGRGPAALAGMSVAVFLVLIADYLGWIG